MLTMVLVTVVGTVAVTMSVVKRVSVYRCVAVTIQTSFKISVLVTGLTSGAKLQHAPLFPDSVTVVIAVAVLTNMS